MPEIPDRIPPEPHQKVDWPKLERDIIFHTNRGEYSTAFKLFQDVRRNIGSKPAPFCWREITETMIRYGNYHHSFFLFDSC